ncbi:hypothetical protein BD309DRAFT_984807 [Dichomitus squalens]|nr:hypothetical protein BD309DRAFT_984807 [Dichomitus squalens]
MPPSLCYPSVRLSSTGHFPSMWSPNFQHGGGSSPCLRAEQAWRTNSWSNGLECATENVEFPVRLHRGQAVYGIAIPQRDAHGEHGNKPPKARLDVPVSAISQAPQCTNFDTCFQDRAVDREQKSMFKTRKAEIFAMYSDNHTQVAWNPTAGLASSASAGVY